MRRRKLRLEGAQPGKKDFEDLGKELQDYYRGMDIGETLHADIVKCRYLHECNLIGAMYNYLLHCHNNSI